MTVSFLGDNSPDPAPSKGPSLSIVLTNASLGPLASLPVLSPSQLIFSLKGRLGLLLPLAAFKFQRTS